MFELNLVSELSYHSLFNNMSCILYNEIILINVYNLNNYCYTSVLIFENYFLISKVFWLNQLLNLNYLYFSVDLNIYSLYLWKYNFFSVVYYYTKSNILLINNYQKNLCWLELNNNFLLKYYIINKQLPKISNNFQLINFFVDNDIFPYNNGELYFFYEKIFLDYSLLDSLNIINNIDNLNNTFYIKNLNKANIINYLILNNNYLLSFLLDNNWYNYGFKKNGYLYYTLPLYWDYDYILGIYKYLENLNIFKNIKIITNQSKIYNFHDLILNNIVSSNYKIKFLYDHLIIQEKVFSWIIKWIIFIIYFYIINYKFNFIIIHVINFINWFLNILIFCLIMKIQDYIFYYLLNPLYLYFGKNVKEVIYWYSNIINKKNLHLTKNKKDCDSNLLIFYYDFVNNSYIKYLTYLLISLIFKYIYITFIIIIYNIIIVVKFNILLLNYFNLFWIYLMYDLNLIKLHSNYLFNIIRFKSFWTKFNYCYLELFNFSHQNKLISNNMIISILNWINYKEFEIFNFNKIYNKMEYNNEKWRYLYDYINFKIIYKQWSILNNLFINFKILFKLFAYKFKLFVYKFKYVKNFQKIKNLNIIKSQVNNYKTIINTYFFTQGLFIYIILDSLIFFIKFIYRYLLILFIKLRLSYILIIIMISIFFNLNFKLIVLPLEMFFVYEFPWINELMIWFYNKNYYFISEWMIYEQKYIFETIKIKIKFLKLKENIWNNIFVHFNFQKKKWQNVTEDKIWNFINPIYFLIFLIYELQIQWFIYEFYNYIFTSILIKILFNYMPFLYWFNLNLSCYYIINYININLYFALYWLKCYYTYIYIYLFSNFFGIKLSIILYKYIYIYIKVKNWYYIIYKYFIGAIMNQIINIAFLLLNLIIFNISIILFNNNITNFKYIFMIMTIIILDIYNYICNYIFNYENILLQYINIFIFFNLYIEVQNNLDIINSYIRINKYKIYKWNKFSRKKRNYRYFIKTFLIEYFYAPTYENHLISLATMINDNSFNRVNIINYWTNINIYIKYWYWIINNYFDNIWIGFGNIYYWNESLDVYEINNIYQEDYFFDLLYFYINIWWNLKLHLKEINQLNINSFYIDQFELMYKSFFNLSRLYLKIFINYITLYFISYYFLFIIIWNYLNKHNKSDYNLQYVWQNFKEQEKKNEFINFSQNLNNWARIILSKKIKLKKNFNFNLFLNLFYNIKKLIYINQLNFINNNLKFFRYIKIKLQKNPKIKNKIKFNFIFYFNYNLKNVIINLINFKTKFNYKNIYNRNSEFLYLISSYFYKKNYFAYLINKLELYKSVVPINKNYYLLNINNVKIQKSLNNYILKFFHNIDEKFFNNYSPNWLINKSNTTIFYNFSINDKKEILDFTIIFPYEIYFFFINIIYIYIYYKIIIYGIIWNQKFWIGPTIFEKREWFNLVIYNNVWINFLKLVNLFENTNSSLLNTNSTNGIFLQQLTNIFINTNKYYYFNKLYEYKNNVNIFKYGYYFQIKDNYNNYLCNKLNEIKKFFFIFNICIISYILGYKIIYKNYIYKLIFKIKNIKQIKFYKFNLKKLQYIYFHYKFKKMLWNNYFFKNKL